MSGTGEHHSAPVMGDVPLFLVEPNKLVDHGPSGISLGAVKLYAWQVHPVVPVPVDFSGSAAYLIKVNYEFRFEPGVPAAASAEVGFRFEPQDVMVSDALPRSVVRYQQPEQYWLTTHLAFAPVDGNVVAAGLSSWQDPVALPAVVPQIGCSGIGGAEVRWRHQSCERYPIPHGTHSGWLVLVVPESFHSLRVIAMGDCDLGVDTPKGLAASAQPDAFTLRLPTERPAAAEAAVAALERAAMAGNGRREAKSLHRGYPRVFVSYAQESPGHKAAVQRFCDFLCGIGVDVHYDQVGLETRRSWLDWSNIEIRRSDFVVVIASPMYRAMSEGEIESTVHRGIRSEYDRITDELHRDRDTWIKKILPVVLPGRTIDEIPRAFAPHTQDHYHVSAFTEEGAADLLTVLRAYRRNPSGTGDGGDGD